MIASANFDRRNKRFVDISPVRKNIGSTVFFSAKINSTPHACIQTKGVKIDIPLFLLFQVLNFTNQPISWKLSNLKNQLYSKYLIVESRIVSIKTVSRHTTIKLSSLPVAICVLTVVLQSTSSCTDTHTVIQ